MNDWEKELGIQMYVNVFKALQQYCEEHPKCEECVFQGGFGVCFIAKKPIEFNIERIEKAIRQDIERSEKNEET